MIFLAFPKQAFPQQEPQSLKGETLRYPALLEAPRWETLRLVPGKEPQGLKGKLGATCFRVQPFLHASLKKRSIPQQSLLTKGE